MKRISLAALLVLAFAAPASAWWSRGNLPDCDASGVIDQIKIKFLYGDKRIFHTGLWIERVTDMYERPRVVQARKSLIRRRYCSGTAWFNDGSRQQVIYLIESGQGFASMGYAVQSCMPGYDRWHTYDGWCQSIRP